MIAMRKRRGGGCVGPSRRRRAHLPFPFCAGLLFFRSGRVGVRRGKAPVPGKGENCGGKSDGLAQAPIRGSCPAKLLARGACQCRDPRLRPSQAFSLFSLHYRRERLSEFIQSFDPSLFHFFVLGFLFFFLKKRTKITLDSIRQWNVAQSGTRHTLISRCVPRARGHMGLTEYGSD